MKTNQYSWLLTLLVLPAITGLSQSNSPLTDSIPYDLYPQVLETRPELPSPVSTATGETYVVAVTSGGKYAVIPVTLDNELSFCRQLVVDTADFPVLAETGLHSAERLETMTSITGRSLDEITRLGRPGGLSQGGFMAEDENIRSVLTGDNRLVSQLGLTHPALAEPLFHVLNMMATDLSLNRWNMAKHRWDNIRYFYYYDQVVHVMAEDTKGGQQSIFDDGIEGGFFIKIWRELESEERQYLQEQYAHLPPEAFQELRTRLSSLNTGEMQPQYIIRYGFYEGHTYWRTDPLTIAFIFGLKSLEELDRAVEGRLYERLTTHYVE